jgi:hypothetical protein
MTAVADRARPNGKAKSRPPLEGAGKFGTIPADKKKAFCKFIYDLTVQKGLTDPQGYLVADVFAEVWHDISDSVEGRQKAQYRFENLLRSAPEYFELFRKGIQVAKHSGRLRRLARKGEMLVRLVQAKP